jgi:flagellar motor switch protein FliM
VPPAQLFDFRDPLPMPAAAAGLVASVTEAAHRVGLLLGLASGRTVSVSCPAVRRVALREVTSPGAVWAPLTCGLSDPGLLLVPGESAVALADLFLGGFGEPADRPASALEQQLLVQHLVPALKPLAEALASHGVTMLRPGAVSDRPLPVGGGEVVAIALEVVLAGDATVQVSLCLPAKSLLPAETEPPAPAPTEATQRVLADVPVQVAVRLAGTTVTAVEVEDLHPGDVIRIDPQALSTLVGVLAGAGADVPAFTASLGSRGRQRAVVVVEPSAPHPERGL